MRQENAAISQVLDDDGVGVLAGWLQEVDATASGPTGASGRQDAAALLRAFRAGCVADGDLADLDADAWAELRDLLQQLSRTRAAQGSTAAETSHFVLSFKRPLFAALQDRLVSRPAEWMAAVWAVSNLVDRMAQLTMTTYQRTREEVITRQQEELLELSTPVVKLWDGVLAAPMIGTLDSSRTQMVMESLLQRIVDTGSALAIIDITGVPTVDTLVAQHLMKTVTAIRLMGADCIISGIRPQIAQTIVHLGIDLQGITTKATLADALSLAMRRMGYTVTKTVKA